MRQFVIVSYYTADTLYEKEIQNLIQSCQKFGLETDIVAVPNLKDWNANCHYKPPFILDRLKKHQCPVVWLDADSVITQYPKLFETTEEECMVRMRSDVDFNHPDKVISSTIYCNYSPTTIDTLRYWIKESEQYRNTLCDQECLKNAIQKHKLNVSAIPLPYCRIEGLDDESVSIEEGVIRQFQASRLLRKIVDEEVSPFGFIDELSGQELQQIRFSSE